MTFFDLFAVRFLLASGGCIAAGLGVWGLALLWRRRPAFQLQRSAWLLAQLTIAAVFLVILLPHSERLRLVPPIELARESIAGATSAAGPAAAAAVANSPIATPGKAPAASWLVLGARAWLLIYLAGLVHALARLMRARRLLRGLAAAGCPLDTVDERRVEVIEVDAPISPMLFGLARPRLLLPRHLRSFDPLQRQLILAHELTHVRRRDLHWMSAGLLLQTLFWFNPVMRLLRAQLAWAQELGCDRDVLAGRSPAEHKAYAAALVAQLKTQHRPLNAALAFGGVSPSSVAARIGLVRQPAPAARSRVARMAALGALAAIVAASLVLQPALGGRAHGAPVQAFRCTTMSEAGTGARLVHEGHCDERVTPASTANIAISLMGYDSAILVDEHTPALPFKPGYADWNASWRATTDPSRWMQQSVVWYAQQVTMGLGAPQFQRYVQQFGYGNQDVSGDTGKDNGLTMSWINSSLKISPAEQTDFLARLVNRRLAVSAKAYDMTERIMQSEMLANGWTVHGKTGTANPVLPNGKDDEAHQYGWYVGWATKGQRTVVFAHLELDRRQPGGAAGPRAKDSFLRELPARLDAP